MANYILGGVMNAEAFVERDGKLEHYFSAKTLTDSTVNISVTSEEIRGGEGAQLLGRFFHTSNFGVNLTDALFDFKYLEAQIGSDIELADAEYIYEDTITLTNGAGKLSKEPAVLFGSEQNICVDAAHNRIAWIKDCDGNYVTVYPTGEEAQPQINITGVELADGTYCVKYPITQEGCRQVLVKAMYQPKEFKLVLTGNLFAGSSCSIANSSKVGKLVIEIPRFQLDGSVDLGLNMSSAATIALNGFALASGCGCGDAQYAKMSEILDGDQYQGYTTITVANKDDLRVGDVLKVYAAGAKKLPKRYYDYTVAEPTYVDGNGVILEAAVGKTIVVTANTIKKDNTAATVTTGTVKE